MAPEPSRGQLAVLENEVEREDSPLSDLGEHDDTEYVAQKSLKRAVENEDVEAEKEGRPVSRSDAGEPAGHHVL